MILVWKGEFKEPKARLKSADGDDECYRIRSHPRYERNAVSE
jgi:hypothetical protein